MVPVESGVRIRVEFANGHFGCAPLYKDHIAIPPRFTACGPLAGCVIHFGVQKLEHGMGKGDVGSWVGSGSRGGPVVGVTAGPAPPGPFHGMANSDPGFGMLGVNPDQSTSRV